VCRALGSICQAYVEEANGNPHLRQFLEVGNDFDAVANQQWFLDRVKGFIVAARDGQIVLDQDPAAIVFAYSRMLHNDGAITTAQYASLLRSLLGIEEMLHRWTTPRVVLCLDAPAEVLRSRVVQRVGEPQTPRMAWFDRVRSHFLELFGRFPNAITLSTVGVSPEQVISRARALIENRADGTQA
jgi:deoxyadenosine/deoxycytidine kinase